MNFEKLLGQEVFKTTIAIRFSLLAGLSIHAFLCVCRVIYTFFYRFKRLFLCFTWSEMSSDPSLRLTPPPPPPTQREAMRETRPARGLIVHLLACPCNV